MACDELTGLSGIFTRQNSASAVSLDFEPDADYKFVETLEDRYKCAYCHLVLHNPHQTGCGHRFCQQCILTLRELNAVPTCPVDKETIKMHEVFKDNCCKREVLNLHVFCKNFPDCNSKIILGRYQNHEKDDCPDYPVPCLQNCSQIILKKEIEKHHAVCPETEVDCPYKQYGCLIKVKRGKLAEHENGALREHMLQILDKNSRLEEQISDLYKSLESKEIKIQQLAEAVKKCEKEFRQFTQLFGKNSNLMVSTQALASHLDKSARLESQVKQLIQIANQQQSKLDLRPLFDTIENVKQKIALMESYDQRLVVLEGQSSKHDLQINIHKAQLNKNEERFKLLEGTCYSGKLIWKITDYKMKKKEAVEGRVLSIFSQPFYTSRCGYRLCARAYLNGDGSGKGTHVSLYFVVMRGEFDSLLPWPFKQKVTLMLLDQSGKKNHIVEIFRADPNSSSFKRPDGEMNIASGCPRFVPHTVLENTKNTYLRDDTLFLKVVVDLTDLEEL
ncbi:TNF receptor-associated factor 5 isoform X2 [Cygnus atratus]|uniref:TNF receptor-associated factor 5 isoform X2 n=1 Tax=Cygnus atratus TaxID=8868 RepID=UPI0021B74EEF|nr:TNF receptor-associated factor 5 isoform X2 [Cygnus atratus]